MPANPQLIEGLQVIVTQLAQQADGHIIQSRIFGNQGFKKLEEKYAEHAEEERGYVIKCATKDGVVHTDPIEWVKYDLEVSVNGLAYLKGLVELARDDYTTYDILKDYYKDEEEDMYWGEQQLELIEKIGKQNWLVKQL
ncbi:ferritin-like superfamily [Neocallimastix sp. 'constans']